MIGFAGYVCASAGNANAAAATDIATRNALRRAGIGAEKIDYINAHGTSTPLGDEIELGAVKRLFGRHSYELSMSSTKSAIGHLLGAAGAVEAVATVEALNARLAPPTLGYEVPDPELDLDYVPGRARELMPANGGPPIGISNSFSFGGHNVALVFRGESE